MMYSFDEIGLIPSVLTSVEHRGDVNPYTEDGHLPIFVAPMTCIINKDNFGEYLNSKVIPITPVTKDSLHTLSLIEDWQSVTLQDFSYWFNAGHAVKDFHYRILIDCANGHMKTIYSSVADAKTEYPNIEVMIGNIANPETYIECCKAGIDYVRVGIGGGSGCTTSVQTGIHVSMPYLLEGINKVKVNIHNSEIGVNRFNPPKIVDINGFRTKVVADGGINTIDKAVKCLALGADYVMMGSIFAQCKESATDSRGCNYYGQSSELGQLDRFGKVKSNPEGIAKYIPTTTTLVDFTNKFEAALRSAMSYANAMTLSDFHPEYRIMSASEFKAYNK